MVERIACMGRVVRGGSVERKGFVRLFYVGMGQGSLRSGVRGSCVGRKKIVRKRKRM
jgi:hypothetical protein